MDITPQTYHPKGLPPTPGAQPVMAITETFPPKDVDMRTGESIPPLPPQPPPPLPPLPAGKTQIPSKYLSCPDDVDYRNRNPEHASQHESEDHSQSEIRDIDHRLFTLDTFLSKGKKSFLEENIPEPPNNDGIRDRHLSNDDKSDHRSPDNRAIDAHHSPTQDRGYHPSDNHDRGHNPLSVDGDRQQTEDTGRDRHASSEDKDIDHRQYKSTSKDYHRSVSREKDHHRSDSRDKDYRSERSDSRDKEPH